MSSDGRVDRSFGQAGLRVLFKEEAGSGLAISVDRERRVVAAGFTRQKHTQRVAVVRLTASGRFDRSFGNGGKLRLDLDGDHQYAEAIEPLPHGILLGGGDGKGSSLSPLAIELHSDGRLDRAFGRGGVLEPDFGSAPARIDSLTLASSRKVLAAGSGFEDGNTIELELARFQP
jgi:hypothetical protein